MILRRVGQGLLVIEHREDRDIKPAFKEVKLNPGRPMAMALQDDCDPAVFAERPWERVSLDQNG